MRGALPSQVIQNVSTAARQRYSCVQKGLLPLRPLTGRKAELKHISAGMPATCRAGAGLPLSGLNTWGRIGQCADLEEGDQELEV